VWVLLDGRQHLFEADIGVADAIMCFRPISRRVFLAQCQRVHVQLSGKIVEQTFHRE
jgi:hypothetical protein